jgi:hypothetical protein
MTARVFTYLETSAPRAWSALRETAAAPKWPIATTTAGVNEREREIRWDAGGRLGILTRRVVIEPIAFRRCRYLEEVAVSAGFLTPAAWLLAHVLCRCHQRRWRKRVRRLET